jgi:hypothetical protein
VSLQGVNVNISLTELGAGKGTSRDGEKERKKQTGRNETKETRRQGKQHLVRQQDAIWHNRHMKASDQDENRGQSTANRGLADP